MFDILHCLRSDSYAPVSFVVVLCLGTGCKVELYGQYVQTQEGERTERQVT